MIAASHQLVLPFRKPANPETGMTLDTFHFRALRPAQTMAEMETFSVAGKRFHVALFSGYSDGRTWCLTWKRFTSTLTGKRSHVGPFSQKRFHVGRLRSTRERFRTVRNATPANPADVETFLPTSQMFPRRHHFEIFPRRALLGKADVPGPVRIANVATILETKPNTKTFPLQQKTLNSR